MASRIEATDQGARVSVLKLVCQDCGHVILPGESPSECCVCGGKRIVLEDDPDKTIVLQCAS